MADVNNNQTTTTEPAGAQNTGATQVQQHEPQTQQNAPTFDEMLKNGYQAEFDRRVSKAIATAQGKFSDPKVAELEQKLTGYMQRESVMRAGVRPEFTEFVQFTVERQDGDFDANLKSYLEANPQYAASAEQTQSSKPNGWGQTQQGGNPDGMDGVERRFRELNPNLKI